MQNLNINLNAVCQQIVQMYMFLFCGIVALIAVMAVIGNKDKNKGKNK